MLSCCVYFRKVLGGMLGSCMIEQGSPLGVHFTMFLPALKKFVFYSSVMLCLSDILR